MDVNNFTKVYCQQLAPEILFNIFWELYFTWLPSQYLFGHSQLCKHQYNVWYLFKENSKNTRTTSVASFWCVYYLNTFHALFWCFHSLLWTNKCRLRRQKLALQKLTFLYPGVEKRCIRNEWAKLNLHKLTLGIVSLQRNFFFFDHFLEKVWS